MISVDTTPFEARTSRTRDRSNDATTCGYCRQRVPRGHECEEKREAMKERKCRYRDCGALFKPRTHAQAYCCPRHKDQENDRLEYERKPKRAKQNGPKAGFKEEINTIAPIERRWAKASEKAAAYAPLMGEALYETTMRLMRAE